MRRTVKVRNIHQIQPFLPFSNDRMKRLLGSLFFWLIILDLQGQATSVFKLLQQDTVADMFLTIDWKQLEKKKKEKEYYPAHLEFRSSDQKLVSMDLKVRTRGNMRLEICSSPPLKLKFDKNELARHSLAPHNEIDLVQPCHTGELYDQFILREYLAYKLYQVVSPYSYQVQLVRIHYQSTGGGEAHEPKIAILVENTEELVDRIGGRKNKTAIISKNALDAESILKVSLFEFMIGNTDWFIQSRHNLEFVAVPGHSLLITVPYDFDYSGLVSTPYAAHHESIDLPTVALRYYQGKCAPKEQVLAALNIFKEKKEILLNMYRQIPGMKDYSIKHVQNYLEDFFTIIENPKKTESHILQHCDMWPVAN